MGRIYARTDKKTTGDCLSVDIRLLARFCVPTKPIVRALNWTVREKQIGACVVIYDGYDLIWLRYTAKSLSMPQVDRDQFVAIERTPCNYGNSRPWFCCPDESCNRRVAILYYHSALQLFLCRHCCNLAYQCQRESEQDRWFRKRNNCHRKLGHKGSDSPVIKPRYMHQKTWQKLTYLEAIYLLKALRAGLRGMGHSMGFEED